LSDKHVEGNSQIGPQVVDVIPSACSAITVTAAAAGAAEDVSDATMLVSTGATTDVTAMQSVSHQIHSIEIIVA